jgi:hypothetical protein
MEVEEKTQGNKKRRSFWKFFLSFLGIIFLVVLLLWGVGEYEQWRGEKNIAVRFSEYEPMEFVMKFKGLVNWVWVDCFNVLPLNDEIYTILKENFKICLVSPELQGYSLEKIEEFKDILKNKPIDAVCTKKPELW